MVGDLYLVRHGATEWALNGRHTGMTDLPLLPEGERQARALGERLRGMRLAAVWSSDRQRALRTAELAGFEQVRVTPLLREFDYGQFEGLTSDEIWQRVPGWQIYRDGCPGGERPEQVAARAAAFLAELSDVAGAVAVFSHGHMLRALATVWLELPIEVAASLSLDAAAISVLHEGDRGRVVHRWNWSPEL